MEITELDLIRRIRGLAASSRGKTVVGIGDDTAVVAGRPGYQYLVTTDALVEGTHFRWDIASAADIGRRSLVVNCSDIAAMGGYPLFALVSLGVPEGLSATQVAQFYEGMLSLAKEYSLEVSGGDIVRSPVFFASVFVVGEVEAGKFVTRAGARAGDSIYITGSPGCAVAGLDCLLHQVGRRQPWRDRLVAQWLRPTPRISEGRAIAPQASAMIDTSDGLSTDLMHILEESNVGGELWEEAFLVADELRQYCEFTGRQPIELILEGGEDYELLFTCSGASKKTFAGSVPVTKIGMITDRPGLVLVGSSGGRTPLEPRGWDHFRRAIENER